MDAYWIDGLPFWLLTGSLPNPAVEAADAVLFDPPGPLAPLALSSVGDIASAEVVGLHVVGLVVSGAGGIASAEAFGIPAAGLVVSGVGGIATAEAFGIPVVGLVVSAVGGIASAEAFGLPVAILEVGTLALTNVGGIASAEAFGVPTVSMGEPVFDTFRAVVDLGAVRGARADVLSRIAATVAFAERNPASAFLVTRTTKRTDTTTKRAARADHSMTRRERSDVV